MVTMSEIYRFTVLRRPASVKPEGVELFSGDADVLAPADEGPEWSLSRVPGYRFLQQLEATNKPLTNSRRVRPLIEALGQRPSQHLDARRSNFKSWFATVLTFVTLRQAWGQSPGSPSLHIQLRLLTC